jgi:hypothetical protein
MVDAKPFKVFENAINELRPTTAGVEVLDPEPERSVSGTSLKMAKNRRKSVTKMKAARGGGGETCDLQDSLHRKPSKSGT